MHFEVKKKFVNGKNALKMRALQFFCTLRPRVLRCFHFARCAFSPDEHW